MPLMLTVSHAAASDTTADKAGMGCTDRTVLHTTPGMAHNMMACMPANVSQADAQAYWDAHDAYYACLQDTSKTADDCAPLVASGMTAELAAFEGGTAPAHMKATLCALAVLLSRVLRHACKLPRQAGWQSCIVHACNCKDAEPQAIVPMQPLFSIPCSRHECTLLIVFVVLQAGCHGQVRRSKLDSRVHDRQGQRRADARRAGAGKRHRKRADHPSVWQHDSGLCAWQRLRGQRRCSGRAACLRGDGGSSGRAGSGMRAPVRQTSACS
jgi:hypothetical protein